jgi:hypothetical protein
LVTYLNFVPEKCPQTYHIQMSRYVVGKSSVDPGSTQNYRESGNLCIKNS